MSTHSLIQHSSPGASELPTRLIAERVVALYYPQTRAFVAADGIGRELRQITSTNSSVLRAVLRLRVHGDNSGCRSAEDARRAVPGEYDLAMDAVEGTLVRDPIPRLQVVGAAAYPFLYAIDWPEGTPVRTLRREGRDRIRLLEGVADRLAVLGPLLRPLIQLHWVGDVARWSGVALEDEALRVHLFGSERVTFPRPMVADLRDLQGDACFYCGERLGGPGRSGQRAEVDHFLAWTRWPNDAIENLVLADGCNGAKSDHLAAGEHLTRWRDRVDARAADLAGIAERHRWLSDHQRSTALVQTTYSHVSAGTPLWRHGREFVIAAGPIME